uniref:BZIP domain-containing protein n=1 Tax=Triticum aestivum TaxID=4565 RepID=A0A077RRE6_WHEAT|nr:unnamed protein product [Triticum aestivum]
MAVRLRPTIGRGRSERQCCSSVVRGSCAGGQAHVPAVMVHGHMNQVQQGQQPGLMMYPMALANDKFSMMGDVTGFGPNRYAGMAVVLPPPPPQGGVGIVSPGSSDGWSAMTQADMTNYIGDGAMMENVHDPEDQSSKRSIEHRHRRVIKNHESATRSRARNRHLHCCQNCWFFCNAISAIVAYIMDLEAELNYLKEEKACLKDEELVEKMMEQSKEKVTI